MKKRSKIIVGVLVLFLVMVVGYAIFTQTLKINGTATARGNLDLTYECVAKEEHGGTGTCKIEDDKSITTTSTLSKPNDYVEYYIKITNTGTIPAVLKNVDSPNNVIEEPTIPSGDEIYLDTNTLLVAYYRVGKIESDDRLGDEFRGDTAVENANITLQPGEAIGLIVTHGWGDSDYIKSEQPELPEGGATLNYNLTFGFQQIEA